MSYSAPSEGPAGRLWFGVLGGGLAWTLHLLLVYGLAESACATTLGEARLFGLSALDVLLLGITLALALLALLAALVAFGNWRRLRDGDSRGGAEFMGAFGLLLSGLFAFIILAQGLPVFLVRACG